MPDIPPLRDIDDFLVYPAEFRIRSLLRAEHREVLENSIAINVLYYQVNYVFLAVYLSALVLLTAVVFHISAGSYRCTGAVFIAICGTACYLYCKDSLKGLELQQKHYFALIIASNIILWMLLTYLVDYLCRAFVFVVCVTLATLFIFLHASLREPNLDCKTQAFLEYMSIKKTLLGAVYLGIDIKLVSILLYLLIAVFFKNVILYNSFSPIIFLFIAIIIGFLHYSKSRGSPSSINQSTESIESTERNDLVANVSERIRRNFRLLKRVFRFFRDV